MNKFRRIIYKMIPDRIKFAFSSLWESFKDGQPYYSQNGEDVVLMSMFKKDYAGFYIDIGAHHPKKYSNTYMLHKRGWEGINIDANPASIKAFKRDRPSDTNLNIGVSDKSETLTYYQFADPAVNTFSQTQASDWIENKKWNMYLGSKNIDVQTVNSVLEKHTQTSTKIDLLNIDVEGLDERIINALDFKKYKPEVIIIEDHNFTDTEPNKSSIYSLLTKRGYTLHTNLSFSLIFKINTVINDQF